MNIRFISAGAGSGKTYTITQELYSRLQEGKVRPECVMATTFTRKAAAEMAERVREKLAEEGRAELSMRLGSARIGTVNSVCGQLLAQFAFEAGLSPRVEVIPEEDGPLIFNRALEEVISQSEFRRMNSLAYRLGIEDWQAEVRGVVDRARANDMNAEAMTRDAESSISRLLAFLPKAASEDLDAALLASIEDALGKIRDNGDGTKGTANWVAQVEDTRRQLKEGRPLSWSE